MKRKNSKPVEELEDEIRNLKQRVEGLEKELQNVLHHKTSFNDIEDEEEFALSDHDSSSFLNDSLHLRSKSGKLSVGTDIAYLYSVPLVREHNSKILSMGLPIDHNAEIDDIIKMLQGTNKGVGFRMDSATIDSLQNLLMIKPKVVHLSCHGEFDRVEDTYYLAFESKKVMGMMEKLSMSRLKTLFSTQMQMKSIECVIVSACHSQKIGEMMKDSGVPVVICINAPFKIQDEAAR